MRIILSMVLYAFALTTNAQLPDAQLRELGIKKAADLAVKMGLDPQKQKSLANLFYGYDLALSKYDLMPRAYISESKTIYADREIAIAKLLEPQEYKLYKILENNATSGLKESYFDILDYISDDSVFMDELFQFEFTVVLPILSKLHHQFSSQMTREDQVKLVEIQDYVYHMADSLKILVADDTSSITGLLQRENPITVDFQKLLNKYEDEYVLVLKELVPYNKVWYRERQNFLKDYLGANLVSTILQKDRLLAQAGLERNLNKMEFFLMDPYDRERYLKNARLFFRVGQALVFDDQIP